MWNQLSAIWHEMAADGVCIPYWDSMLHINVKCWSRCSIFSSVIGHVILEESDTGPASQLASFSLFSALFFWPGPIGLWSKVVHYIVNRVPFDIVNRVPFGMQTKTTETQEANLASAGNLPRFIHSNGKTVWRHYRDGEGNRLSYEVTEQKEACHLGTQAKTFLSIEASWWSHEPWVSVKVTRLLHSSSSLGPAKCESKSSLVQMGNIHWVYKTLGTPS